MTDRGWPDVSKGIADYLVATDPTKVRIEWFAERGVHWCNIAQQPLTDENGRETERYRVLFGKGRAA